jgi:hypothetical protein
MNLNDACFEVPAARTRHDAVASGSVLGAMLLCALAGAVVIEVDPASVVASERPAQYAAVEEAQ